MAVAVQTQREILAVLKAYKPQLQQEFLLQRLALFASWARGDQTQSSDIDILVEVALRIGLRFVTLAQRLEELLGREVDLVSHRRSNRRFGLTSNRTSLMSRRNTKLLLGDILTAIAKIERSAVGFE